MKGRWQGLLMTAGLVFSSAAFGDTCQQPAATPIVNRSFKLTVADFRSAPKAAVKVVLGTIDRYNTMHPVSSGTTDKDGVLNFAKLPLGNFSFQLRMR